MSLHELTHPCTDDLVGTSICMEDGSHALTENIVMLADYYLIKEIAPELVDRYFKWIYNKASNPNIQLDENMLKRVFPITKELDELLNKQIKEVVAYS